FVVAGCGSSTVGSGSDMMSTANNDLSGGNGAHADLAMPADMASPAGGFCGGMTCTGNTSCCVINGTPSCTSSCPAGGFVAKCQKPADCPGATDACCITVSNFTPQSVMCTPGNQCVPAISAQGSGTDRACVTSHDCTDNGASATMLPDCCTSKATGQHICFSAALLTTFPQLQQQFSCP